MEPLNGRKLSHKKLNHSNIIYSNNFFIHDYDPKLSVPFHLFNKMVFSALEEATQKPVMLNESGFDREVFYRKSNISPSKKYFFLKKEQFLSEESSKYLRTILQGKILIGFEFGKQDKDFLDKSGVVFLNFLSHPFKLFDDLAFSVETNNPEIYKRLQNYQISPYKFKLYGNYWNSRLSLDKKIQKLNRTIKDNSLLIIGQSELDKSLEKDGYILSLNDFQKEISGYKKRYGAIYYAPHPNMTKKNGKIDYKLCPRLKYFLKKNPDIIIVNNSTYSLLACDKIKKVIAISSSVIFEAGFFNKETQYLFQPLFEFDNANINDGTSIDSHDLANPKFWSDVLCDVFDTKKNVPNINFDSKLNKIRDIHNMYWGYSQLDNLRKLIDYKEASLEKFKKFPLRLIRRLFL